MALELENLGLSGMVCTNCKKHLTNPEEQEVLTEYFLQHDCGKELYIEGVRVKVLHRYQHLLDIKKARKQPFWYHATNDENWPKDNKNPRQGDVWLAHIGSKESALDRAAHQGYSSIYKLTIDPETHWSPHVTDDWNEWPTVLEELDMEIYHKFSEVTRYVNRYEIPGSISLLVASDKIHVVDCEAIPQHPKEIPSVPATSKPPVPCQ